MPKLSGSCLCGAVSYKGEAEPLFAGNCHCNDCRKSSAGGHMALMAVPAPAVEIIGEVKGYEMKADSGATVTHHFCPNCGSQIYNTNTNMEGVTVLVATTLDNPEVYRPLVSVFASRALSWDQPNPATQQFDEMPPMGD